MFDALSDRLQNAFQSLKGHGKLSAEDIDAAMREIRLALLEADVNFKVVREFVAQVKVRALGAEVMESLTPAQQVIKIVNEELTALMGSADSKLAFSGHAPTIILMAGLQGSGKTTTCAKLAKYLKKDGKRPVLIAADVYRPAAIDQLKTLGERVGVPVYAPGADVDPVDIARDGVAYARQVGDVAIIDTAGRLHIDEELMDELARIRSTVKPHNILLVVDAMTGQDAVNAAEEFRQKVDLDGVVLTKLDGDARGGAALSVRAVTGRPIKFASTARSSTTSTPSIRTAWPRASSAWATSSRSSRRPRIRSTPRRRPRWRPSCGAPSSASRTSSSSSSRCARWARSRASSACCPACPA